MLKYLFMASGLICLVIFVSQAVYDQTFVKAPPLLYVGCIALYATIILGAVYLRRIICSSNRFLTIVWYCGVALIGAAMVLYVFIWYALDKSSFRF